ncbi:MAG: LON peptidase substrate-binding domain-containing protein, partial [Bdellovibrionota bacterium]
MMEEKSELVSSSASAPVLILTDAVLFPGTTLPIVIASHLGIEAVNVALSRPEKSLIAITIRASSQEKLEIQEADLYQIGTKAVISRMNRIDGSMNILLNGISRVKVERYSKHKPYFDADITNLAMSEDSSQETEALHRESLKIFGEMRR